MRKIAIRKIVRMRKTLTLLKRIIIAYFLSSMFGIALFLTLMPYDVILIDSFLWVLEALLFTGMLLTLYVVTSKTLYGARYELLRGESLVSPFIALFATLITLYLIVSKANSLSYLSVVHTSDIISTLYVFSGALVSLIIWRYCVKFMRLPKAGLAITSILAKTIIGCYSGYCIRCFSGYS